MWNKQTKKEINFQVLFGPPGIVKHPYIIRLFLKLSLQTNYKLFWSGFKQGEKNLVQF